MMRYRREVNREGISHCDSLRVCKCAALIVRDAPLVLKACICNRFILIVLKEADRTASGGDRNTYMSECGVRRNDILRPGSLEEAQMRDML